MTTEAENPWYAAKELLIKDYQDGHIPDDMEAREVQSMREEYLAVRPDRFSSNFKRLKNSGFQETKKKEPNYWSIAKPLAFRDYVDGIISDDMDLKDVHVMRPEYKAVRLDRFVANFKSLIQRIEKDKKRAITDLECYTYDTTFVHKLAKDRDNEWHGSEAQQMLREDIEAGVHQGTKPKQFRLSRVEYQCFPLKIFQRHFYQEIRRVTESGYWLVKKAKKEAKKKAKRAGKKYKEDCNDFFDPVLDFNTLDEWNL